jgi:predicted histidine transporter YuiF (NhaC family)
MFECQVSTPTFVLHAARPPYIALATGFGEIFSKGCLQKNKQHKPQAKRGKNKEEKTRVVLNSQSESSVQTELNSGGSL